MIQPIQILLIEDNPADADLTRETLEASKLQLSLDVAIDGIDAMEYLHRRGRYSAAACPDLVLLDLNLPKKNGREVLAEMRADQRLRCIPVVILTSSDAERDVIEGYALGANCYVVKPVDLKAFQSIVNAVENFWFSVVKLPTVRDDSFSRGDQA
jgi:DNA-binding response OmpR family regulator